MIDAPASFSLSLADERATEALAARLAGLARQGDVIALAGPLGSGKTSFARAFIRARFDKPQDVPSPTFTLVEIYSGNGPPVWHFDLFRLAAPEEAWELGIEDAFSDGISLIEWPERLGPLLPYEHLSMVFAFGATETARTVRLDAAPSWASRIRELGHA